MTATARCPNGHDSLDREWCDTCGAPIGGPPEGAAPGHAAPPQATPQPAAVGPAVACPNCGAANPANALFCEGCGFDFTTGQRADVPVPPPAPPIEQGPTERGQATWIVIVTVDPAWFALKGSLADQALPPPSSRTIPLHTHTALVGRSSTSRGLRPEVALDDDTGVSRRHAQFVADGVELTVVDLSSTNGTYVVPAGTDPDGQSAPLVPGVPSNLGDGDRVFVGAWTSLTVRRAAGSP